jgi:hypothetical protein
MARSVAHHAECARGRRVAARIGRVVVLVAAAQFGSVGAVVSPMATMLWAPAAGLSAVAVSVLVNAGRPTTPSARRAAGLAFAAGALAVPAMSGLALLGDAGNVLLVALLVLGGIWAADAVLGAPATDDRVAARRELATLRRVVTDLPSQTLLRDWRRATCRLGRDDDPEIRAVAAAIRALVVDELSRRDPAGLEHWLRHGDGDPRRYVPGGPQGRS